MPDGLGPPPSMEARFTILPGGRRHLVVVDINGGPLACGVVPSASLSAWAELMVVLFPAEACRHHRAPAPPASAGNPDRHRV